jgi:hypothetical protein
VDFEEVGVVDEGGDDLADVERLFRVLGNNLVEGGDVGEVEFRCGGSTRLLAGRKERSLRTISMAWASSLATKWMLPLTVAWAAALPISSMVVT